MNDLDLVWDEIIELGIATKEELALVTCISGNTLETLNNIVYARIGYHSLEQYKECELND